MRQEGKRILVAGIGNVFHGDDAFGVEVVRALATRELPEAAQVTDFGTRSYDLAFAMLDGYEAVVLVDAASREKPPGSLFVLDAQAGDPPESVPMNGHALTPEAVLGLVKAMGGYDGRVLVVGCEPATFEPRGGEMDLSAPVRAAVEEAADLVERLVDRLTAVEGGSEGKNGN